jgi:hypothetical protein
VQEELRGMFEGMGAEGPALYEQLISTLRNALNSALVQVFLVFLFVVVLAIIVNFFLKGIPPLKNSRNMPPPAA